MFDHGTGMASCVLETQGLQPKLSVSNGSPVDCPGVMVGLWLGGWERAWRSVDCGNIWASHGLPFRKVIILSCLGTEEIITVHSEPKKQEFVLLIVFVGGMEFTNSHRLCHSGLDRKGPQVYKDLKGCHWTSSFHASQHPLAQTQTLENKQIRWGAEFSLDITWLVMQSYHSACSTR